MDVHSGSKRNLHRTFLLNSVSITHIPELRGPNVQTIKGLIAEAPDPELKDKLMLFGQFVGDWEIDCESLQSDGKWVKSKGELHFGWILDGIAVQDVWITRTEEPQKFLIAGTTLRFYDRKLDAWQSVWISPMRGIVRTFVARKMGDEIVLEGTTKEGYPERWIFSEITPGSFHWRAVESEDHEKTWRLTEKMSIRRAK